MSSWAAMIEALRGKPKGAPDPFDRQANAAQALMGFSDIIPEAVTQTTGSDLAGMAAGFLSPTSMLRKQPVKREMIRKGGDPNLLLTHGSSFDNLLELLRQRKYSWKPSTPTLDAPSMAIGKKPAPFEAEVELYMQPQRFDPATNPRSDLYSTDIYSYRKSRQPNLYARSAQLRKDPMFTEGEAPSTAGRLLEVAAAQKFPSYEAYENSWRGAKHLKTGHDVPLDFPVGQYRSAENRFLNWFDNQSGVPFMPDNPDVPDMAREYLLRFPEEKALFQQMPQDYAELKYHGPVALTPENIAAVRIPNATREMAGPEFMREITQMLNRQQIPIMRGVLNHPAATQEQIAEYVDQLTGLRGQRKYPR